MQSDRPAHPVLPAHPAFDEPCFTRTPRELGLTIEPQAPLPEMHDPDPKPLVVSPRSEALVRVEHRRIRVLANYWHAGWEHALSGAWLRESAMERLAAVAGSLPPRFGLAVFDAWRSLELQTELYEAAYSDPGLGSGFLAPPDADPAVPPPHLTGGTVDVTLTFDGTPLALGTAFDDSTEAARIDSFEQTPGPDRDLRRMLFWRMCEAEFVVFDGEWWHFEYGTRRWAAIRGCDPIYGPASVTK